MGRLSQQEVNDFLNLVESYSGAGLSNIQATAYNYLVDYVELDVNASLEMIQNQSLH